MLTRNLNCLWCSQLLSQIADGITKLALLWFVYSVTGSALQTTAVGILQTVSSIVCTPLIGLLVDRLPKKPILVVTDLLRGVILGVVPWLLPSDGLTVDVVYLLVFVFECSAVALGAALVAPRSPILTSMGFNEVIMTFVVVVLGGIGSIGGALAAGLGLGLFIAFFGAFVAHAYTTAAAFALMLVLLVVRPAGLAAR